MSSKPIKKDNRKLRVVVLETAAELTGTRRCATYGEPNINLTCAAELQRVYKEYAGDKYSPAHDVAINEIMLKLSRIATGKPGHEDNYIDGAAYFAIAHECQELS